MPGYFQRLARQSGLIPAKRPRAGVENAVEDAARGAAGADIVEIHEERVIGGDAPPGAQASAPRAPGRSVYNSPADAPSPGRAVPGASVDRLIDAPARARDLEAQSAPARDVPAPAAPVASGTARAAGARDSDSVSRASAAPRSASAAPSAPQPAPGTTAARAPAVAARSPGVSDTEPPAFAAPLASPSAPVRASAAQASAAPARAAETPAPVQQRGETRGRPVAAAPTETPPRRAALAAPAPLRDTPAPRARDHGVKVHIGKINVEIRAPAPRPVAPTPPVIAPAISAPAPAADAAFSAYRHYLRGAR